MTRSSHSNGASVPDRGPGEWPEQAVAGVKAAVLQLARLTKPSVADLLRSAHHPVEAALIEDITSIIEYNGINTKQISRQKSCA